MNDSTTVREEPIVLEYTAKAHSAVASTNEFVLQPIAGSRAFRRYNWLLKTPAVNKSGNLRGMVINKDMRTVYKISGNVGDKLAVLGALIEITREMSRIQRVYNSDASSSEKYSRITLLGSAAILRSVTSVVPTAVELSALSIQGYAQLFSLASGSSAGYEVSESVGNFAKQVREIHKQQWDGENWYNVIEATID